MLYFKHSILRYHSLSSQLHMITLTSFGLIFYTIYIYFSPEIAIFKYEQNQLAICVILAHLPLKALFIFTVNIEASIHMCNYFQKERKKDILQAVCCKHSYMLWNKHLWSEVLSMNKTSLVLPIFLQGAWQGASVQSLYIKA